MTDEGQPSRSFNLDRIARIVLSGIGVVTCLALLRYLSDVLIPFAIAVLLAYLINPVVTALERRIKSRAAASLVTVFGCLVVLASLVAIMVPLVTAELSEFGELVGQLRADAPDVPDAKTLQDRFDAFVETQESETIQGLLLALKQTVVSFDYRSAAISVARRLAPGLWSVVTGALSFVLGLTGLIIILLYLVFLSIDYPEFSVAWKAYLPPTYRDTISGFVEEFSLAMSRYFRGQFLIAASVGVLFAVGFSIIGLRMGIILGLFVGALNMVPYLQTVGLVPAVLLAVIRAIEHESSVALSLVWVLLVFAVVQLFQDAILVPRIMGKQTGLRPAVLLLGVFVWGKLLGFLGLVLAIPLTCIGIAAYRRAVLGHADACAIPTEDRQPES